MWFWFLVATGILMSCRVSGKPIVTALTGGMTSDRFPSTQQEDTYLRFKSKAKSIASDTDDKLNSAVLQDAEVTTANNDVNKIPNVASSNGIQNVTNDRKDVSVPSSITNERNTDIKTSEEERSQQKDTILPYVDNNVDTETQSIGNMGIYRKQTDNEETLQGDGAVNDKPGDEYSAPRDTANENIYGSNVGEEEALQNIYNENLYDKQSGENEDIYGNQEEKAGTRKSLEDRKVYDESGDGHNDIGNGEINRQLDNGIGALQSITKGDNDDEENNDEQGESKVYGDANVVAENLKDDGVVSRAFGTQTSNGEQSHGSSEATVADNKEDLSHIIMESNVDGTTKDSHDTLNEGESNQEYEQEAVDADISRYEDNEDNDIDSASVEDEEVFDLDAVFNILKEILDGEMPGDRYNITNTTGQVFDNQDNELRDEGYLDSGKVYLHSQPNSVAPKEMTQSEEKTAEGKDEREYPRFQAVINISQTENSDIIDLDDISERVISEVQSLALPLLQIAQDTSTSDDTGVGDNREVNPRGYIVFENTPGGTVLAIRENNGNRDSLDEPLQTVNEISIIYSL